MTNNTIWKKTIYDNEGEIVAIFWNNKGLDINPHYSEKEGEEILSFVDVQIDNTYVGTIDVCYGGRVEEKPYHFNEKNELVEGRE